MRKQKKINENFGRKNFKEQTKKIEEKTFTFKMKKTLINLFLHPNEKKKARIKKFHSKSKEIQEKFVKNFCKKKVAWARQLAAPPPRRGPGAGGR